MRSETIRWKLFSILIGVCLLLPLISYAETLDTWVMRNPALIPGNYNLSSVILGKINNADSFVIFGNRYPTLPTGPTATPNPFILTSPDGANWI